MRLAEKLQRSLQQSSTGAQPAIAEAPSTAKASVAPLAAEDNSNHGRSLVDELRRRIKRLERREGRTPSQSGPPAGECRYEIFSDRPKRPPIAHIPVRRLAARHWETSAAGNTPLPAYEAVPSWAWEATKEQRHATTPRVPDETGLRYYQTYEPGHRFGRSELSAPTAPLVARIKQLAEAELQQSLGPLTAEDLLFFDTETTGLSRAAGTVAFMIGLGYFEGQALIIEQLLVDDLHHEAKVLQLFSRRLSRAKLLVSFNGRSFDIPVLEARSLVNRVSCAFDIPHLDLLPLSRRFFRARLPDCRLATLERQILGFHRVADISGAEAPQAYFRFLQHGVFDEVLQVLEHNLLDVATLALLLERLTEHVLDPLTWAEDADELLAAGRYWLVRGERRLGLHCLERAPALAGLPVTRRRALAALGQALKREKHRERARQVWQSYCDEYSDKELGWLELAKHHEHVERDFAAALACALRIPDQSRPDVVRRVARLEQRLERSRARRQRKGSTG